MTTRRKQWVLGSLRGSRESDSEVAKEREKWEATQAHLTEQEHWTEYYLLTRAIPIDRVQVKVCHHSYNYRTVSTQNAQWWNTPIPCASWCNVLRRTQHHFYGILAKNITPEPNEKTPNTDWEIVYKTTGLYSSKTSIVWKETWQHICSVITDWTLDTGIK